MDKPKLLNLPNALTVMRIMMIPAFVWLYFRLPGKRWVTLIVYVSAALTDLADGYIARRLNQITWFGKLFDPLADKLMTASMLICLVYSGEIAWWPLAVFVAKEGYMVWGAWFLLKRKDYVVKSDRIGKAATFGFVLSTCLIFPWHGSKAVSDAGRALLYLALALSIAAAIHYTLGAVKNRSSMRAS